ncbi:hypothetical protein ACFLSQ_07710 [Bacteroidota bacterium]
MKLIPRGTSMYCLFLNDNPDVSSYKYNEKYINDWIFHDTLSNKDMFVLCNESWELDIKFKRWGSGTKIYVVVYSCQAYEVDKRNNKVRWLGLGEPSNVVEFTIPEL